MGGEQEFSDGLGEFLEGRGGAGLWQNRLGPQPQPHRTHRVRERHPSLPRPPHCPGPLRAGSAAKRTATTVYGPSRHGAARRTVPLHRPRVVSSPRAERVSSNVTYALKLVGQLGGWRLYKTPKAKVYFSQQLVRSWRDRGGTVAPDTASGDPEPAPMPVWLEYDPANVIGPDKAARLLGVTPGGCGGWVGCWAAGVSAPGRRPGGDSTGNSSRRGRRGGRVERRREGRGPCTRPGSRL